MFTIRRLALGLAAASFVAACSKVPQTGRAQFNVVPDEVMKNLGQSAFQDVLATEEVERQGQDVVVLQRVGERLAGVVDREDYDWRFALIDSQEMNAWALPGGYIGFYTGILPVLENEAGMAFVMGHEVGHTTANHGAERLSQQLVLLGGLGALDLYLGSRDDVSAQQRQTILGALGLGAQVGVVLPYSRAHESEADVIGLMYMARAGYPPKESIDVWKRMDEVGGERPPQFLSTHPDPQTRIAHLREWLPRAEKRYERNALPGDTTKALWTGGAREDVSEPKQQPSDRARQRGARKTSGGD